MMDMVSISCDNLQCCIDRVIIREMEDGNNLYASLLRTPKYIERHVSKERSLETPPCLQTLWSNVYILLLYLHSQGGG